MKIIASFLMATISIFGFTGSAFACHPVGEISKSVVNVSESSANVDTAVTAKAGDVLEYTIELKNTAKEAANQDNDLIGITLTDNIPEGLELVSDPDINVFEKQYEALAPGDTITETLEAKVVSDELSYIENEVCYEATTIKQDRTKKGCASVKVSLVNSVDPNEEGKGDTGEETDSQDDTTGNIEDEDNSQEQGKGSEDSSTTEEPSNPEELEEGKGGPISLPNTGTSGLIFAAVASSLIGYWINIMRLKKNNKGLEIV